MNDVIYKSDIVNARRKVQSKKLLSYEVGEFSSIMKSCGFVPAHPNFLKIYKYSVIIKEIILTESALM